MREVLPVTKALSDRTRLRSLMALRTGELCLCQLIDLLQLAPSTVSKHMAVLHQAGLVNRRKEGRWHFYRLADRKTPGTAERALEWLTESLAGEPMILEDEERLKKIRKKDLVELSTCYRS